MDERFVVAHVGEIVGVVDMKRGQWAQFQWASLNLPEAEAVVRARRAAQWLNDGSMTPTGFVWVDLPAGDTVRPLETSESPRPTSSQPGTVQRGTGPYSPAEWGAWSENDDRL
jgi:hypothetical protein